MGCKLCKYLTMDSFDGSYLHQADCPEYVGGLDADKLRGLMPGVIVGTPADEVLELLGAPLSVGDKSWRRDDGSLVVDWCYKHYTLTMARGELDSGMLGLLNMYAVQRIDYHGE